MDDGSSLSPSDFALYLSGEGSSVNIQRISGQTITVYANTAYTLSEDPIEGYTPTEITCVDDDNSSILNHPVSLTEGQSVTCTISNIDYVSTFYVIPLPSGGAAVLDL